MARRRSRNGRAGTGANGRRPVAVEPDAGPFYAALDLGTNSCRMLIATPDGPHFRIVDAFSKSVRLGVDLERTGALSNQGIARTLQALRVCSSKIKNFGVADMRLVATEACRRARNGQRFLRRVEQETGLRLEIITPQEEARLAVISCASLIEPDTKQLLVIDIGGGSTELVWIDVSDVPHEQRVQAVGALRPGKQPRPEHKARIVDWISVPLGVATLHERYADVEDDAARFALMSWFFEENILEFGPYLAETISDHLDGLQMIGTSGTITTVGAAHLGLRRYDRTKVDGMRMTSQQIDTVIERYLSSGPEGRRADPTLGKDRAELIMSGSAILQTLLRIWPTDSISVADRGLREGILFSMMSRDGVLTKGPANG
ncbi:Ppx/GppA phosphatase family protein [Oceanomicrobium pacificus]|uniref:Ppx/GppA family phosphatase n=1 Tax=Oceanomicrobium pacificus TaxID=2692916 RepID=A0A6B0TNY7_9RHOB|nr:Ppx/GppA phosphatase family protein [Oceanomicrobium pacificus]MXU66267.1 Ppx/GppA family phosphatase [Oceanomicrobium pacificus]